MSDIWVTNIGDCNHFNCQWKWWSTVDGRRSNDFTLIPAVNLHAEECWFCTTCIAIWVLTYISLSISFQNVRVFAVMLNASMGKKEESQRLTFQFLFVPCRQLLSVLRLHGTGRLVGAPEWLRARRLDITKLRCHPPDRMYPLELVHFRQTIIFYSLIYSVNIIIAEYLELPSVSLDGGPSESLYKQLGINIIAHHSTAAPLHRSQSADNAPTFL